MKWPWVSRALLEREQQFSAAVANGLEFERGEVRRLTDVIIKMRRRQFELVEPKKAIAPPDVDANARRRAEAGARHASERRFIDAAAADLIKKGADPVTAEKEARRLYEEATDLHPAGG